MINEVLSGLEQTRRDFWNVPRVTGMFLNLLARQSTNILEIGTSNGYSGIWLASSGTPLTTIEFWEKRRELALANFKQCGLKVNSLQGDALEVIKTLTDSYDLVFIDANKTQYLDYFRAVHPLVKKGGIILCDNVLSHKEKCKPLMDAFKTHPDYKNVILPLPAGLSMATKLVSW
jgi:predicted O-methyltransferase YrrM